MNLNEFESELFELEQKTSPLLKDVEKRCKKELEKHTNDEPFFLRIFKWLKWDKKRQDIIERHRLEYQNHPLVKKLQNLQDTCHHKFSIWQKEFPPYKEHRTCRICRYREERAIDM